MKSYSLIMKLRRYSFAHQFNVLDNSRNYNWYSCTNSVCGIIQETANWNSCTDLVCGIIQEITIEFEIHGQIHYGTIQEIKIEIHAPTHYVI